MRKGLLYFVISAAVGLIVIMIPILVFTTVEYGGDLPNTETLSKGLGELEGTYSLTAPGSPISELEALTVSFVIALFVYLLTRRRLSSRRYEWRRMVPY